MLDQVLTEGARISVSYATDEEPIQKKHVCIAPPDCHLTVEDGRLRVLHGPREKSAMQRRLAEAIDNDEIMAERFREQSKADDAYARLIREMISSEDRFLSDSKKIA